MRTTFYTCCDKKYQDFIPIFIHSILYHNDDADVEIGVDDINLPKNITESVRIIMNWYPNSKVCIRSVSFDPIVVFEKTHNVCVNVVRFINEPSIKNDYVYISDIDIIMLQNNISELHISEMIKTGLNYSNIVRPYEDKRLRKLTGLHFTKWDAYYPINNFEDIVGDDGLAQDEVFLFNLVSKRNIVSESTQYRPVHGIHVSPNRTPNGYPGWGLSGWIPQWHSYRKSNEFIELEGLSSDYIKNIISQIDEAI